jgi:Leucine-rich repeat (LRR) protein
MTLISGVTPCLGSKQGLGGNDLSVLPRSIKELTNLTFIDVSNNPKLSELPFTPDELTQLKICTIKTENTEIDLTPFKEALLANGTKNRRVADLQSKVLK